MPTRQVVPTLAGPLWATRCFWRQRRLLVLEAPERRLSFECLGGVPRHGQRRGGGVLANLVHCNNINVVYLSTNPDQHQRTKHVEIDLHFIRERVANGDVCVVHVRKTSQFADIFTKGLPSTEFHTNDSYSFFKKISYILL
jgi:hypothetical protein